MTINFKGHFGSPSFTHNGSFEKTGGGIEKNGMVIGQIGGWPNRQGIRARMGILLTGHYGEFTTNTST